MLTLLRDLHWLAVRQRITFKSAVMVYKCLHSMAPTVPSDVLRADRRQQSLTGVFDPLTLADWLFHAPDQTTVTAASPSQDLGCGTVFLLNWVHRTMQTYAVDVQKQTRRHFCFICNCYAVHLQLFRNLALYKCT